MLSRTGSLILDLWQRTRMDWGFVSTRLSRAFRELRIGGSERRFVSESLYGMVRHVRRLDEALALGGVNFRKTAPDHERLIAYLALEEGLEPGAAARLAPAVDWGKALGVDEVIDKERDPAVRLGRRYSVPDWIAKAVLADHGDEAGPLLSALNARAPMTVRANVLKGTRDQLAAALAAEEITTTPGVLGPWALTCESRVNLFALEAFKQGLFEAQDEGSQLIAELVAPPPQAIVLDLCAGAGGKTLATAAHMNNGGRIIASDADDRKLTELKKRARRAGVSNTQAVALSADFRAPLPATLEGLFGRVHRVLLDVPCTGMGALRRNPEIRWRLDPDALERMPALQGQLIDRAVTFLRPGGRIVYATCSVFSAENRAVVTAALQRHPGLELVPVKEIWGRERAERVTADNGTFLELLPHRHGTDGFFAAVLRQK